PSASSRRARGTRGTPVRRPPAPSTRPRRAGGRSPWACPRCAGREAARGPAPMIVLLGGATGTGKTSLSLDVAEAIAVAGGMAEVVNADAMQLYRGMDIGTAKLSVAERR